MKKGKYLFSIISCAAIWVSSCCFCYGQANTLFQLRPLETSREKAEQLLGPPAKFIPNYGTYENELGRFSVWYSSGNCSEDRLGPEWSVAKNLVTNVVFYPNQMLSISSYTKTFEQFAPFKKIGDKKTNRYISIDETIVLETSRPGSDMENEKVYSVSIEPGIPGLKLLCHKLPC